MNFIYMNFENFLCNCFVFTLLTGIFYLFVYSLYMYLKAEQHVQGRTCCSACMTFQRTPWKSCRFPQS